MFREEEKVGKLEERFRDTSSRLYAFNDFYFFINLFELRYDHLFSYNFGKPEFINLKKITKELHDFSHSSELYFIDGKGAIKTFPDIEEFNKLINQVLQDLKFELK